MLFSATISIIITVIAGLIPNLQDASIIGANKLLPSIFEDILFLLKDLLSLNSTLVLENTH